MRKPIITVSGKSSQSFRLTREQLAKCMPYQHLDCNIFPVNDNSLMRSGEWDKWE